MIEYTPTLVSRPANTAVTGVRAVGYESGNQKNSGKIAALMPNTMKRNRDKAVWTPSGSSPILPARSAMFMVPVAAYTQAMPTTNNVDATTLMMM